MFVETLRRIVLAGGLIALLGAQTLPQSSKPPLPKSHRHIGVTRFTVGEDIPEFKMGEALLETGMKKESLVTTRSRRYEAFTVSGTRLFVTDRRTGKILEITGLPLEWRPFSDLIWADNRTLMFDRWSQPHYAVHYAVDVESRRLVAAVPFGEKVSSHPQRPKPQQ